jgi:flagella basal body P-ring formation protein FlgA
MTRITLAISFLMGAAIASADTVVATGTIRANTIISPGDVSLEPEEVPNAFSRLEDVIGQEARTTVYTGRPVYFQDVGPPALVTRNQIVLIEYQSAGLRIVTEARALQRGAAGDRIRIMNLDSKATLFGRIQENGTILVSK